MTWPCEDRDGCFFSLFWGNRYPSALGFTDDKLYIHYCFATSLLTTSLARSSAGPFLLHLSHCVHNIKVCDSSLFVLHTYTPVNSLLGLSLPFDMIRNITGSTRPPTPFRRELFDRKLALRKTRGTKGTSPSHSESSYSLSDNKMHSVAVDLCQHRVLWRIGRCKEEFEKRGAVPVPACDVTRWSGTQLPKFCSLPNSYRVQRVFHISTKSPFGRRLDRAGVHPARKELCQNRPSACKTTARRNTYGLLLEALRNIRPCPSKRSNTLQPRY